MKTLLTTQPNSGKEHELAFTMYSTQWCGYCRRLKGALERNGITVAEVDIDADPAAAELVMKVNNGDATVPTLVFSDGTAMTNPTPGEVMAKLAAQAPDLSG